MKLLSLAAGIASLVTVLACRVESQAPTPPAPAFQPPDHGFFTSRPKKFGRLEKVDPARREITFTLDDGGQTLTRRARPDLDLFLGSALAPMESLRPGDRLWLVLDRDAAKKELTEVRFLTDEIGLQTIHSEWFEVAAVDTRAGTVKLVPAGQPQAPGVELTASKDVRVKQGSSAGGLSLLTAGDRVRYQTRWQDGGYRVSEIVDAAAQDAEAAARRKSVERDVVRLGVRGETSAGQQASHWNALLYRPGGDLARLLQPGARVTVTWAGKKAAARVLSIHPWGEKTQLKLESAAGAMKPPPGQEVRVLLPDGVRFGELPPALGRSTDRAERTEWLLSSIYCTCGNRPDVCTGHLYTLSMCDTKGCGMPDAVRAKIGGWIDAGRTDREILALLEAEQGPLLRRIHLLK